MIWQNFNIKYLQQAHCLRHILYIYFFSGKKMKKNKKGRGRQSSNIKDGENHNQQVKVACSVCRFKIKHCDAMLTCGACRKVVHAACYNNDHPIKGQTFTCDLCRQKKRKVNYCVICDQCGDNQMLKYCSINGGQSMSPIHIQCAILSPTVQLSSYSKLQFSKKDTDKYPTKHDCCGQAYHGLVVQCVVCSSKGHFRCKIVELGEIFDDNYMVSRWLDKCEKYQFLLNYIVSKKKTLIKTFLDGIPKLPKQNQIIVCNKHNQQYPWCYCDSSTISKKPEYPDYQCDQCDRFVHQACSGLPPKYPKSFVCQGCKQNDIFKKQLKLHQLIIQISKVQKLTKFDDSAIRLLNAFPFKYSALLQKKIAENIKQIQFYFAKRQIQRQIQAGLQSQKNIKKLFQLLIYLLYGEKWKQFQVNSQSISLIQQSSIIKKLKLSKQAEQRISQIVNQKTKQQKKSKQFESLREVLKRFISEWHSNNNYENHDINKSQDRYSILARSIKQIQNKFINFIAQSDQDSKLFLDKFSGMMGNQVFATLISKQHSLQLIEIILRKVSKFNYYKLQNNEISQQQYYKLLSSKGIRVSSKQKNVWNSFVSNFKNQTNKLNIVYSAVKKQQLVKKYQNSIKQNLNDTKILQKLQYQAISNQVCTISNDSSFNSAKILMIEQNLLKKKFLRMCCESDSKLNQQKLKFLPKIQEFIRKRKNLLVKNQRYNIENFIGKAEFLCNILRKGQSLQHYQIQDRMVDENGQSQQSILYLKFFHILDHWQQRILSSEFMINQFFHKIIQKKAKYDCKQIQQRIKSFYRHLIGKMQYLWVQGQKISTHILRKICKVLGYFKIGEQFPIFIQLLQSVRKWINVFPNEQIPSNIGTYLEKTQRASNLLKILQVKILCGFQIEKVNVSSQINKMCLLRQWCKLTEKMSFLSKSKATINAMQTLKGLLDKSYYPQNLLFKKVNELQIQGKKLNIQVNKFLQKPKLPEFFKFNQQLKFISNKMSLEEGQLIKTILEKCNLDVYVQTQQLQNQIKQFQALPIQLGQSLQRKTLKQLNSLRKKFIDSCFKVQKIQQYERFLRRIYMLKCINFQPPVTRQQYFQLLTLGGVASIQLQNKTADLLRAYRTLEKAEIQLSSSAYRKRNLNNLLPWAESRYKQLKQDLKFDPTQISKLQKFRLVTSKIREQFYYLRSKKVQMQKLKQIELDLSSSIFNNKDILNEITSIKFQLNNILKTIQQVLPYSQHGNIPISHQNILRTERRLYDTYINLKVRHPVIERFENDCRNYYKSQQIRSQLSLQNYRSYCEACNRMSELACRIPQFLQARTNQFMNMFKQAMQGQQYQMHIFQLLISEGLQLRRLQSIQKQKIFDMVIEVYQRVKQVLNVKNNEISDSDEDIREQDEEIISSEESIQEDEQDDDIDDYDDDGSQDFDDNDDDEDQDEDPNSKANEQIVLDSD